MTKKLNTVWAVYNESREYLHFYPSFADAKEAAEMDCEYWDCDISIFEIVKSWSVGFPEDPSPVIREQPLENL